MRTVILLVAGFCLANSAEAQRCVKGKPCGNTCIAMDKVCHVGQGTAVSGRGVPAAAPSEAITTEEFLRQFPVPAGASRDSVGWPWVAPWPYGVHYYRNVKTCPLAVAVLAEKGRIYFRDTADARRGAYYLTARPECR